MPPKTRFVWVYSVIHIGLLQTSIIWLMYYGAVQLWWLSRRAHTCTSRLAVFQRSRHGCKVQLPVHVQSLTTVTHLHILLLIPSKPLYCIPIHRLKGKQLCWKPDRRWRCGSKQGRSYFVLPTFCCHSSSQYKVIKISLDESQEV